MSDQQRFAAEIWAISSGYANLSKGELKLVELAWKASHRATLDAAITALTPKDGAHAKLGWLDAVELLERMCDEQT